MKNEGSESETGHASGRYHVFSLAPNSSSIPLDISRFWLDLFKYVWRGGGGVKRTIRAGLLKRLVGRLTAVKIRYISMKNEKKFGQLTVVYCPMKKKDPKHKGKLYFS